MRRARSGAGLSRCGYPIERLFSESLTDGFTFLGIWVAPFAVVLFCGFSMNWSSNEPENLN
jgi:hypothetical protein